MFQFSVILIFINKTFGRRVVLLKPLSEDSFRLKQKRIVGYNLQVMVYQVFRIYCAKYFTCKSILSSQHEHISRSGTDQERSLNQTDLLIANTFQHGTAVFQITHHLTTDYCRDSPLHERSSKNQSKHMNNII